MNAHPLIFSEEKKGYGKDILCNGCWQKISGSSYSCKKCSFFPHRFCTKLPVEMKHLMHPEHPLSLLSKPPYPDYKTFHCDACGTPSKAFIYHCSLGKFDVDPVCASRALTIIHESHKHPLIPQLNPAPFECYACGTKEEDVSYQCSTCRFWIHQDCASLPNTIKHRGHNHPLTLSYDKDIFTRLYKCNVCFRDSGNKGWFYGCRACQYLVHPRCILLAKESKLAVKVRIIDGSNSIYLPMRDESISLITLFVKQICLGDNEIESELNHFSHNHPLIFFNVPGDDDLCHGNEQYRLDEENKDKICSGCDRTISASFYGCRLCNFFLHKWCAKLPDELKHYGLHRHPLMFRKEIYEAGREFICGSCFGHFKGFRFQCVNPECGDSYCRDVKCASLLISIVHEIHEQPLLLKTNCLTEGCAACDRRSYIISFGCGTCHFSLHYNCAMLPPAFRHRYDKHPCEVEIDPNYWFYHCIDCDQSACTECILKDGKYFEKSNWDHLLI